MWCFSLIDDTTFYNYEEKKALHHSEHYNVLFCPQMPSAIILVDSKPHAAQLQNSRARTDGYNAPNPTILLSKPPIIIFPNQTKPH
jgi:hypothetical protein